MSVSFDYYKVFYYVAKYKNITAASRALFLSQPTVSRCIQNLENELGCTLFIRSIKGVTLTPEAKILYKHISRACEHIFKAEEELTASKSLLDGLIRIGASELTLESFLLPYLEIFHNSHPSIKLRTLNYATPDAIASLKAGLLDFAIVTSPIEQEDELIVTKLTSFQDIVIAGSQYEELRNKTIHLRDLTKYPLISMVSGTTNRQFWERIFYENNTVLISDVDLMTNTLIAPMVAHNLGIGFAPYEYTLNELNNGSVFQVKTYENIPKRHICIVSHSAHPVSIAGQKLLNLLPREA